MMRLNQGIYGQRQGGTNQMVRVKVPHGRVTPEQLEMLATIATDYSRGWGHLTTRQNVQFHFVQLRDVPEVLRLLGSVGLTSREACGDTVRNVAGCHLAGACPFEVLDITPWAQAVTDLFLRNPIAQRLPRKFKVNFSGCATDCGQAMFNDVGIIALTRPRADGSLEPGFKVFLAGGLGTTPHPAQALEDFTTREDLLPTVEACLRTFDHYGNRDNKLRARMKWLVDTMGIEELRERIIKERKFLRASATLPGPRPSRRSSRSAATRPPASAPRSRPTAACRWSCAASTTTAAGTWPTSCAAGRTARSAPTRTATLGDITTDQFRGLAADPARLRRRHPHHQPPELRAARPDRGAAPRAARPPAPSTTCTSRASSSPVTSSAAPAPTPATSR